MTSVPYRLDRLPREIVVADDLSLRQIAADDAPILADIIDRNPDIREGVTWASEVESVTDVLPALVRWSDPQFSGRYVSIGEGAVVGFVHAFKGHCEAEFGLGYGLDQQYRGHGFATRSILGLLEQVRVTLEARRFLLSISPTNTKSMSVAERLGFQAAELAWSESMGRYQQYFRREFSE